MQETEQQDQAPVNDRQEDKHLFLGRSLMFAPLINGHRVNLVYSHKQLNNAVYPEMALRLLEGGFPKVDDMWSLLRVIATGGSVVLKGPSFINRKSYHMDTMGDVFMKTERTLVKALLTAVFSENANVTYGRVPISFKMVQGTYEFNSKKAFRSITLLFHAQNQPLEDLYRVRVEGVGRDLSMHQFTFEPSITWLTLRYPELRSWYLNANRRLWNALNSVD